MLVRTTISNYYHHQKSFLAPLRRYGGVLGHIFTFDSRVSLFNAFVWGENPPIIRHESYIANN